MLQIIDLQEEIGHSLLKSRIMWESISLEDIPCLIRVPMYGGDVDEDVWRTRHKAFGRLEIRTRGMRSNESGMALISGIFLVIGKTDKDPLMVLIFKRVDGSKCSILVSTYNSSS